MTAPDWAIAKEDCIYCGLDDYGLVFGPRTFIACPCCRAQGTHKACEEGHRGVELSEEAIDNLNWYCSSVRA